MQSNALKTPVAQGEDGKKYGGAFRTISEVAEELGVQQHVLRFWETKFSQIRPMKRGGGRRYYRPEDVNLLKHIHMLLYTEGYTIKGAQKLLKGQSKSAIAQAHVASEVAAKAHASASKAAPVSSGLAGKEAMQDGVVLPKEVSDVLSAMLDDLKALRAQLKG